VAVVLPFVLHAQSQDLLLRRAKPALAIAEFRGPDYARLWVGAFNQALWSDVAASGLYRMVPRALYPLTIPQQPSDFRSAACIESVRKRSQPDGLCLADWTEPPASAALLTIGYAAVRGDRLTVLAWIYDVHRLDPAAAQLLAKTYAGTLDEAGARNLAHQLAYDLLCRPLDRLRPPVPQQWPLQSAE
jgi:hypothetical protein